VRSARLAITGSQQASEASALKTVPSRWWPWTSWAPFLLIKFAQFQYRTQHNTTIGASPFFLLHGYEPLLPSDMGLLPEDANSSLADRQRNTVATFMNEARQHAKETLISTQEARAHRFDSHHRSAPAYPVGNYVMALQPSFPRGGTVKLARQLYRTLQLADVATGELRDAHIDNLKPYHYSEDLRPGSTPTEVPIPHHKPQIEQRAVEHLQRVLRSSVHVLGRGRVSAIIAHILGHQALPVPVAALPTGSSPFRHATNSPS